MTEQAAFTRYYKFHKVKFDAIPENLWPTYYHEQVAFKELFVVGDAIGEVQDSHFAWRSSTKLQFDKSHVLILLHRESG